MSFYDKKYLICSECKNYLSCGPVFIRKTRSSVCGRCVAQNEKGIRNLIYEVTASRTRFPCSYRIYGCQETQAFADIFEYSHEYGCEYRMYKCVFAENHQVSCYWRDFKSKLVDHCKTKHPNKVLNNCCRFKFDARFPHQRTYLIVAFELQFMLHVKVYRTRSINTSKMIAFQLEFLGKQDAGAKFQYTLNIQKGKSLVTKIGSAQILTATEVEVGSLDAIFNGFEGVTCHFTITIRCANCQQEFILGKLFNYGVFWFCEECPPHFKPCSNAKQGCSFKDDFSKISKHEKYFCKHISKNTSLSLNIREYGTVWVIKQAYDIIVLTTDIGLIVAEFTSMKTEGKFEIFIYTPLRGDQEVDFSCKVCIGNPFDGESVILYPKFNEGEEYDWYVDIDRNKHPAWGSELIILIVVQRIPIIPSIAELYF